MTAFGSTQTDARHRYVIRFTKRGDLRWIGHRDLARTWERLLRRAALALRMSEGFHPKPRINFPSALAVGIEGTDEVVEIELVEPMCVGHLRERLVAQAPTGLDILTVERGLRKARLAWSEFQFKVPADRRENVAERLAELLACETWSVTRAGREQPVDVRPTLGEGQMRDDHLRFRILATGRASLRPGDLLQQLGLSDLAAEGSYPTRTKVELA